jgi:hypothetical protein
MKNPNEKEKREKLFNYLSVTMNAAKKQEERESGEKGKIESKPRPQRYHILCSVRCATSNR